MECKGVQLSWTPSATVVRIRFKGLWLSRGFAASVGSINSRSQVANKKNTEVRIVTFFKTQHVTEYQI